MIQNEKDAFFAQYAHNTDNAALEIIWQAKETRATRLDLGNCGLTELPEVLIEMWWVQDLNLAELDEKPANNNEIDFKLEKNRKILRNMPQLKVLDLHGNGIDDISFLQDLKQLTYLDLSVNEISDISFLQNLKQLSYLDLAANKINDFSFLQNLTQLIHLDLSDNQLPPNGINNFSFLRNLAQLTELGLIGNQLVDIAFLENLNQLTSLDLSANEELNDISFLQNLTRLEHLNLSDNRINDISFLQNLSQLTTLDLSFNDGLCDISVLRNLVKLIDLSLIANEISDISVLANLEQLQILELQDNEISDISILQNLNKLSSLWLARNPIVYIPKEIFHQENCTNDLKAYWQDLKQSQTIQNNQLKIMFLGNGCVGKTTLLHWFLDNEFKDLSLEDGRTHGIIIQPYKFKDSDVLAHFWDFGGQEVYHATHRLFLGRRSLYLLVWTTESPDAVHEERHPPQYWLDMIADIGGNERSRVLIVQNLFDGQTERNILTDAERQDYEKRGLDITTYCINAKTGVKIKSLKSAIEEEAEQLLKTNIEELPTSWVNIRKAVADKRLKKDKTLAWAEFENICRDCELTTDPSVILGYLHRAGELFHYHNQFDNQIILDQEWVLKAVYAVLKRDRIERYKGVFTLEDLKEFWQKDNPNLTDNEANIFLNFMLANKTMFYTEGGYQGNEKNPEFVVPQLLPTDKPKMHNLWQRITDKTRHRIQYAFLHRDIIERFIVATAHLSKNKDYWRNGLFIEYAHDEAMIEVVNDDKDGKTKYIHIECTGTTQAELLKTIREEFNKIRTLDKAKEYRFSNGNWVQITGEMIYRAEYMGGFKEKAPIFDFNKKNPILLQSTTKNSMKQYLLDLLSEGKLKEVFAEIKKFADTQSSYFTDPLVLLQSRYNRNERENEAGLSDPREYKIERNRIENSVKSLIDSEFDEGKAPKSPKVEPQPAPQPEKKPNTEGGGSTSASTMPKVYFSYAWNDKDNPEREAIVEDLYQNLKSAGFDVRRDKEDAGYRASIRNFMQEIGQSDCIIVAISDKYLKSENCMFEMYEIYRNSKLDKGAFYDKIFPIRVESIALNKPKVLMDYFKFWEEKEKEWAELIDAFGKRITSEQQEQYRRVKEIAHELGDFLAFLNDMNAKSKDELSKNNFEEIKKAIIEKAK
ncbi:MAG: leucine-rich repeat domain-containing protein [Saprospiraceae bacterium]|nr:leucine-rich repeat domain-containing protein [Saprospiraceae bacterium]